MVIGKFEIDINDNKIKDIFLKISNEDICKIQQVCEQYGEKENEVRYYDVFIISTPNGSKILKKTDKREVFNYETYLTGKSFNVPKYYGKYVDENDVWILIENINGEDLRNMTDKLAILSADSIAEIQNSYWQDNEQEFALYKTDCRFEVYWKRINKRFLSIKNHLLLRDAYQIFLDRQLSCPRTLSNGDFLEFNVVKHNNKVSIIDWGFGGIIPYSLDIARFIAHATEDKATFPFYMNEEQKQLFIKRVYEKLEKKPDYSQYIFDIKLAILNEYIEFIEADEDEDKWYYNHALKLAEDILENNNVSYSYKE